MPVPPGWCDPGGPDELTPGGVPVGTQLPKQIAPQSMSALCSLGWRPIFITGLLRDMLVRHFATPLNIEEFDLRNYLWQENERSGILIETIQRWRGDLVEKRPAVILKRNPYKNVRWGIGDACRETDDGHWEFCTGWVGSHTVFCIHGSGAGADLLATEVVRELHHFHPVIVQYLGLLRWNVVDVGAIAEVEEARESFVVPITVGWAYQDNWRLELESMKLRRLSLGTLLRA